MADQEGVIRFELEFEQGNGPDPAVCEMLEAWRQVLRRLGLIGQDPARYGGLGYGNLSMRCPLHDECTDTAFVVSATQTGGIPELGDDGYALVLGVDVDHNRLHARGQREPSSEAMTHGAVYQADVRVGAVVHVHSPGLWQAALVQHDMPVTPAHIGYGTPDMARAVQGEVRRQGAVGCLAMGGHEDGILTWGHTLEEACMGLLARYQHLLAGRRSSS